MQNTGGRKLREQIRYFYRLVLFKLLKKMCAVVTVYIVVYIKLEETSSLKTGMSGIVQYIM